MTTDMMNLRDFVEKTPDADLLRELIGFAAERLMELEVGAATGAAYREKDLSRLAQRNGYRERDWGEGGPAIGSRECPNARGRSICAFRSCGRAATFQASSSRGAWPRRP